MGRGKAQKRRAKNVLKAKQKGDSIGPLPPPPVISKKKSGEYVPRSFQRMMSLKAALERKDAASHKRPPIVNPTSQRSTAQRSAAAGSVPGKRTPTAELDPPRFLDEDPAQQDELALLHNPHTAQPQSVPGMEKADGQTGQAQLDRQDWMQPGQRPADHADSAAAASTEPKVLSGKLLSGKAAGSSHVRKADQAAKSAEEPFSRKAVRPSRKEYLKARKARRKKKGGRAADGDEDEREAQLLQDRTKPAFGEQALAPIKVNLKRRHWDPNDGERRANERCKQIFLKQMSAAERQNTLAANTRANAAPSSGGRSRAEHGKAQGAAASATKVHPVSLAAQARAAREAQANHDARLQLIEAYRQQKRQKGAGKGQGEAGSAGTATARSLAALVRQEAGKAALHLTS